MSDLSRDFEYERLASRLDRVERRLWDLQVACWIGALAGSLTTIGVVAIAVQSWFF